MNSWAATFTKERTIQERLAEARELASQHLRSNRGRYWWQSREQYRRFHANADPVSAYPEETEHYVRSVYDDAHGFMAYRRDTGRMADAGYPTKWQDFLNMIGIR